MQGNCSFSLQLKSSLLGIGVEHLHSVQGELVEIFSYKGKLLEQIVRHGDNMTSNLIRVKNIQQFTGACPDQFLGSIRGHNLYRLFH